MVGKNTDTNTGIKTYTYTNTDFKKYRKIPNTDTDLKHRQRPSST